MGEPDVVYVVRNPGVSVEQIKDALSGPTKVLHLAIVRMVAAKKLTATGQRRGTTTS